jgi:hypothetical protein
VAIVVKMQGQTDLLKVIGAVRPVGRLAGLLHGRHRQADQDADDGNDHQEFDEGEAGAAESSRWVQHFFPRVGCLDINKVSNPSAPRRRCVGPASLE